MNKAVYLFYGEEDFLIEEKINALKAKVETPLLNIEILDGENVTPEALSSALQTAPMFGGEKLVIARGTQIDPGDQEAYLSLIKGVPSGVRVVFHLPAVDKRSKLYKLLDEIGMVEEFKTFAPWELEQLIDWIKTRARRGGKKIADGAARLLQEICGNNLRLLAGEIEKLITYIGERDEIGEEDVSALASPAEKNVFALLDALREKDLKKTLLLFQFLLKNKEDLFQLLGLIAAQYRLMLQIKALPKTEKDPWKAAKAVGGSPYFVRKCLEGIDRFTLEELKEALGKLLDVNLRMKTGESQTIAFELLLTSLCGACLPAGRA